MKKNSFRHSKHIISACIGTAALLLLGFSACDFQPAQSIARNRPVGGGLAQGKATVNEFLESGGGGGGIEFSTIQSGDYTKPLLTKEKIKEMLDETDAGKLPSDPTQWYDELPRYTAPYKAGKLKQEYLNITVKRLNVLRELAGLPGVVTTDKYNDLAQHGAALMVITQNFGHGSQPKVADMDQNFYNKGIEATKRGNVYPQYPLIQSIDGYNLDPGNPGVGHRLWQLNPGLEAVGIGSAIKKKDANGKEIGLGGNVEVVTYTEAPSDQKPEPFDWNFISWPNPGYFPLEGNLFGSPSFWHVQFNKDKYIVGAGKIIVTKLDTGEQWAEEHSGGLTLVFNKSNTWRAEVGSRYTYEVTGVRNINNIPERFIFTTEFFSRK